MKNIFKKTITFSIILLLIGVSVSSAYSIDTESPVVNKQSEEDCNCKEIESRHLVLSERQLNRIGVYTKLLLVLSRDVPEVKKKCEEVLDLIHSVKSKSNLIICSILFGIFLPLYLIAYKLLEIAKSLDEHYALATLFGGIALLLFNGPLVIIAALGLAYGCNWIYFSRLEFRINPI